MFAACNRHQLNHKLEKEHSVEGMCWNMMDIMNEQHKQPLPCCMEVSFALQMIDMDLNDDAEKKIVEGVFQNAVDILNEQDRRLPHVHAILPMLKRGVGVHHSGLLPILKEVIEILFQEGLIKVIFKF